jgi:hypothetical protein
MKPSAGTLPLLSVAGLATYLASCGLAGLWRGHTNADPEPIVTLGVAAAMHAAWILPATLRRQPVVVGLAGLVTWSFCRDGLVASGFQAGAWSYAVVLEGLILALALGHSESATWPDRLARWRRARERMATELRIAEGLVPWGRTTVVHFLHGRADRPTAASFQRVVAELADGEDRMRRRIASLVLPDAVREIVQTAAHSVTACAETTAAELAMAVERQALDQAAGCRDAIATCRISHRIDASSWRACASR